jgi:hypothetical protein
MGLRKGKVEQRFPHWYMLDNIFSSRSGNTCEFFCYRAPWESPLRIPGQFDFPAGSGN